MRGRTSKSNTVDINIQINGSKLVHNVGTWLGNSQRNFQLHRSIKSKNITQNFRGGGTFWRTL